MTTVLVATVDDFPPEVIAEWKADGTLDRLIEAGAMLPPAVRVDMVERMFFNPTHEKATGRFGVSALDGGNPEGADGVEVEKAIDDAVSAAESDPDIHASIIDQSQRDPYFDETKAVTTYRLDQRLRDDPDWQALVKENQYDQDIMSPRDGMDHMTQSQLMASALVGSWAGSSSDDNPMSLEMQHAANVEFGLKGASAFATTGRKTNPWKTYDADGRMRPLSPAAQRGVQKFTRAQYDLTQETLGAAGIDKVKLYRGVHDLKIAPGGGRETFQMNPLSSFSTSYKDAGRFAVPSAAAEVRSSTMMGMSVPRARIFSMPGSGVGCRDEHEVVVLGGKVKAYKQTRIPGETTGWAPNASGLLAPIKTHDQGGISDDAASFDTAWAAGATSFDQYGNAFAEAAKAAFYDIDADIGNADWAKSTWDIPAWTLDQLRAWLRGQRLTAEHFMTLPVYTRNVEKLPWLHDLGGPTVRAMFNPYHDHRTGRFGPKPATIIGVTPNRGKPKQTIEETVPYYGSTRYKNFRHHAKDDVPSGVTLLSNEKVSGFWEGGLEPSAQIVVKGGRPASVKSYATGLGKRFNQDGVVAFTPRKGGNQRLYRWKADDPAVAVAALRSANVMGASVHGGRVEVIDLFGSEHGKMIALGQALGHKAQVVRGDGVLWEKGVDYSAIMIHDMTTVTVRTMFDA